ncbi:hypothetical protein EMCRGX_G019080 [Ephydatia muelleri]
MFTAVDYVTGVLVHDSIEMLQKISDDFVHNNVDKVTLSRQLELVPISSSNSMIHMCNNVDTHGIEYGLKKLHPEKEINAAVRVETCKGCRFNVLFFKALCDKIKATGEGGNPVKSQDTIKDALMVVSDIQQKLELYHAHRVRVANQQKAIYKIEEEMKQECLENKISSKHTLVVIDWKMKFESMSARETSEEHFGKRDGMTFSFWKELGHEYLLPCTTLKLYARRQLPSRCKCSPTVESGVALYLNCNIQEQSFAPTQVDQESVLENEDGSDETEDNEDVADDEEGANRKNMEDVTGVYFQQPPPRMDAVAIAVRCANDLIHSVLKVRSGKDDMVEYLLSQQLETPQSSFKRQGWAWHPAHGDTYGTTYVHLYRTEVKEMFDRGVQTETEKMSPCSNNARNVTRAFSQSVLIASQK